LEKKGCEGCVHGRKQSEGYSCTLHGWYQVTATVPENGCSGYKERPQAKEA
jgi:hypothetical protein